MGAPTAGATPPMRYMASGTGATSASAGPSQAAPRTVWALALRFPGAAAMESNSSRNENGHQLKSLHEVLNIVSGKPTLPTQPQNVATSSVGPARGYAKAARHIPIAARHSSIHT